MAIVRQRACEPAMGMPNLADGVVMRQRHVFFQAERDYVLEGDFTGAVEADQELEELCREVWRGETARQA